MDTQASGETAFAPGETRTYTVLGHAGVPSTGVEAVVVDVAATNTTASAGVATLQVWKTGTTRPNNAVVRVTQATAPIGNTVIVEPDAQGQISVYNSAGTTNLNIDVQGYFTVGSNGGFKALRKTLVSSPDNVGIAGPLSDGTTANIQVTGTDVPAGATAAFVNVAALNPGADGSLVFYPRGQSAPYPKSVNYSVGGPDTTGLMVQLDANGGFALKNAMSSGTVNIRIEIQGYFTPTASAEGAFTPVPQTEVLDTSQESAKLGAGMTREFAVGGTNGLPTYGVEGAVLNVVAKDYTAGGGIKVYPSGAKEAENPTVQFTVSESSDGFATTTIVPTGFDGKVAIKNTSASPVNVKIALQGWFSGYRAIPASDEEAFVAAAVAGGTPEAFARLAVWSETAAQSIPTSAELKIAPAAEYTDEEWAGVPADNEAAEIASAPVVPAGALSGSVIVQDTDESEPPTHARTAATGTCASGYKLYFGEDTFVRKNYWGQELWDVTLKKRWCGSKSTHAVGSIWTKHTAHVYGTAETNWDDKGTVNGDSDGGYLKYDGQHPRSGHYTQRVRKMTNCLVDKFDWVCGSTYVWQQITSVYNGGYDAWGDVR